MIGMIYDCTDTLDRIDSVNRVHQFGDSSLDISLQGHTIGHGKEWQGMKRRLLDHH